MSRVKHQEVMDRVQKLRMSGPEIYVDFYRPGDGVTRYRFFESSTDYFASDGLGTVLGAKQAMIWLDGFEAGRGY